MDEADVAPACFQQVSDLGRACGVALCDADLSALLAANWPRFERARLIRREPALRFCPRCDAAHRGGSAASPSLACADCGLAFCFVHSNAHVGTTCATYEAAHADENREAVAALRTEGAKQCPNAACGAMIIRGDGCNSVVCSRCGTVWCWLCGASLPAGVEMPLHYGEEGCAFPCGSARVASAQTGWARVFLSVICSTCTLQRRLVLNPPPTAAFFNVFGCPNRQFSGRRPAGAAEQLGSAVLTALYFVFFGIPAVLITSVVFVLFACCCVPLARSQTGGPLVFFGTLVAITAHVISLFALCLVCLPIAVPLLILAVLLHLVVYMCRALCGCCGGLPAADDPAAAGEGGAAAAPGAAQAPPADASDTAVVVIAEEPSDTPPDTPLDTPPDTPPEVAAPIGDVPQGLDETSPSEPVPV